MSRAHFIAGETILDGIRRNARLIDRAYEKELRGTGVTRAQLTFLRTIARVGRIRFSKLATEIGCSQPNVANVVHRLAARGWVDIVTYANESRRRDVEINDLGRAILEKANETTREVTERLVGQVRSPEAVPVANVLETVGHATEPTPHEPGDEKKLTTNVTPAEWRDGYPKPERKPRKIIAGVDEARWETLSDRERMIAQEADLYGRKFEDVLAEWNAREARLRAIEEANAARALAAARPP